MRILETSIPTWTSEAERELLSSLAEQVPQSGTILEIGCLYGGATAILALSNPNVQIYSMDDFSWTPEGYPAASQELFQDNMRTLGINNVTSIKGDSRELWSDWKKHIDLLWIDGGHSFEFVYSDLLHFSKFADVIALHDYKNPFWDTIEKAIEVFLKSNDKFYLDQTVDMIAVLRKMKG